MVKGLSQIANAPVEASKLPDYIKRQMVLVPLPFLYCAVSRSSLIGRLCVIVEGVMDYFNPKWSRLWWEAFFDRAAHSDELSPDAQYNLYNAAHVQKLDTSDAKLQAVATAFEKLCPQAEVDAVKQSYSTSYLKTGKPLQTSAPFDTQLFRSLFNMTTHINSKTLLSMFSYALDVLKEHVPGCQTLLNVVSNRVEKAQGIEKRMTGIIAGGRKQRLKGDAERHITQLAQELSLQAKQELANEGAFLFKGGCGSSNLHMRKLIHKVFVQIQKSSIETQLDGLDLKKFVKDGYKDLLKQFPDSTWDNDEVARYLTQEYFPKKLGDFEKAFRLSYTELIKNQSIEEKRGAHSVIKGWKTGDTEALKKYLTQLVLNQREHSCGRLLSDGIFEQYFDECSEDVIEKIEQGSDYLSDEWQAGLTTFIEKGSLDGIPDHMRAWLPSTVSNELAKSVHAGLRKMLADDIFPAEMSQSFFGTFFDELDGQTKFEDAFRSAFSELMQTHVVDTGFDKYNSDFTAFLNQLPPEMRAAFGQMGIDEPDQPIWYTISQKDGKAALKVFHATGDHVEVSEYTCSVDQLSSAFFRQLIEFRVRPRIDEGISYSTDDVHAFLKQTLTPKKTEQISFATEDLFDRFSAAQNVVFAVMQDQIDIDVKRNHLFDLRKQALIDMHALSEQKSTEYPYLLEGAESFAKEVQWRFDNKQCSDVQLQSAFETFWDVSTRAPSEEIEDASQSVWINAAAKQKIRTLAASLGISVKHIQLIRRVIQAGFGADMGPVFDSFIQELLGNPYHLSKVPEGDLIDVGAKIGGADTLYTAHSVLVAYVKNRIAKTESTCLKLALHTARLMLWGLKILLATIVPFTLKITPQVIKDLIYHLFLFFLNITMPLVAKALVMIFLKKENVEAIRQKAFDFERRHIRSGGFDFKLDADGSHHLQLFTWFRDDSDIEIEKNANTITSFQFKSLGLKFNVNPDDGRAYVDESKRDPNKAKKFGDYFIAQDQRLPGMNAFSKFLVLENAQGKKRVVLAEDSLDATVSANLIRALTCQKSSPLLSKLFQGWSDQLFPSHRSETAYFVYDYNAFDRKLESFNPSAMAYLLFYSITQGEIKQAEGIFKKLSVLAEENKALPAPLDPLLRRIQVYCMLQTDRRALFLGIKLAALREQYELKGQESKRDRLAPKGDEAAWEWLEAFGLQTSLLRYQAMQHRLITAPISEFEEYHALKGLQRRFDELRQGFIDPVVENTAIEEVVSEIAPDWVGEKARAYWNQYAFDWMRSGKDKINKKAHELYDEHKVMLGRQCMSFELQKRLAQLQGAQYQAHNTIKARAAFGWIPRFIADSGANAFGQEPYLCDLPFKDNEMPFAFFDDIDEVYGLSALKDLTHLIAHPVGKISEPVPFDLNVTLDKLSTKDLRDDFFSYYRLARQTAGTKEQQEHFHAALARVQSRDPIFILLQHVAKQKDKYPTAHELSHALVKEVLKLEKVPNQSLDPLPLEFTPEMLTKKYLQENFYALYALAHRELQGEIAQKRLTTLKKSLDQIERIDKTTVLLKDVISRHPRHFPQTNAMQCAINQQVTWDQLIAKMRSNIIQNKLMYTVPMTAEAMTPKMLSAHFLDYYRLSRDPTQTAFHAELNRIVGKFDPMTTFLLNSLKIVSSDQGDFPSVQALQKAFEQAKPKEDAALRKELLKLKTACNAPYKKRQFQVLTQALPPVTVGSIEALKVRVGLMSAETIKQNYKIAFYLAKGFGTAQDIQAFQMQIGNLVGTSCDPKTDLLIIALSLIAQNPSKYKHLQTKDQTELIRLVKQELQAAGSVDIARNLPASLLSGDALAERFSRGASGWFGLGRLPNLISGVASVAASFYNEDYETLAYKAAEHASSWAAWTLKTPVPLNSLLFAIKTVKETKVLPPENLTIPTAPAVQEKEFTHDLTIVSELKKIDEAMNEDMPTLLKAHAELMGDNQYKFSSLDDYFKVRQSLRQRKQHLAELTQQQLGKILSFANHKAVDYRQDFSDRKSPVTADELMQIFVTGDQETLQKRTDLCDAEMTKLITLLLAYHQLCTQRQFLDEWEQKLAGIDIGAFRFIPADYAISRPFSWENITTDELRRHLLGASITNNRTALHTDQLAQTKLKARATLYPELAARQWDHAAFTRHLMTAAGAA